MLCRGTLKRCFVVTIAYLLDVAAASYPATQSLGNNWRPYVPTDDVGVECFATHYGEAAAPTLEWIGVVTGVKFGDVELELTCEPNGSHQLARDQGAKWSKSCWKTVYSTGIRGCNLAGAPATLQSAVTRLEQLGTDVAPAAHVLVPSLAAYIAGLSGKTARWSYGAQIPHNGTVTGIDGSDATLSDVTGIEVGTVLDWIDGSSAAQSGTVTAIAGDVVTLDDVTGLDVAIVCNWNEDVATLATATITDAYFAYDYVTSTGFGSQTGFSWNSIGELSDMSGSGWSVTYTKRAALVLSDTTGLAVDSVIEVQMTGGATVATLTAVNGLQLSAAEFATTQFALGGGYLNLTVILSLAFSGVCLMSLRSICADSHTWAGAGRSLRAARPGRRRRRGQDQRAAAAKRGSDQAPGSRDAGHAPGVDPQRPRFLRPGRRPGHPQVQAAGWSGRIAGKHRARRSARRAGRTLRAARRQGARPVRGAGDGAQAVEGRGLNMDAETLKELQDTIKIIGASLSQVLDNAAPNHVRADAAMTVFHGFVAVSIVNDEATLEWIEQINRGLKLIHEALDTTEALARGVH